MAVPSRRMMRAMAQSNQKQLFSLFADETIHPYHYSK